MCATAAAVAAAAVAFDGSGCEPDVVADVCVEHRKPFITYTVGLFTSTRGIIIEMLPSPPLLPILWMDVSDINA
mgnify:CR=1 FL=1